MKEKPPGELAPAFPTFFMKCLQTKAGTIRNVTIYYVRTKLPAHIFRIYVLVVKAQTISSIVEEKKKKDKLILAIHQAMTPHLKMKSTKVLQEGEVWFGIFCESLENRASCMITGFLWRKKEQ